MPGSRSLVTKDREVHTEQAAGGAVLLCGQPGRQARMSLCGLKPLGMKQGKKDCQGYRQILFPSASARSMAHCRGYLLEERRQGNVKIQS